MNFFLALLFIFPQLTLANKVQCKISTNVNGTERTPFTLEISSERAKPCTAHSKTYIVPRSDVLFTAIYRTACKTSAAGIERIEIYDQVTKNYAKTWDMHGPQPRAAIHFVTNGIERVNIQGSCEIVTQESSKSLTTN